MKPYLIQRAKFQDQTNSSKEGIDSILDFDYMGSAEFEFGALSDSLKRIRDHASEYHQFEYIINSNKITVFCKKKNYADVCVIINDLADNKFYLKGYCDFGDWIHSKKNHRNSDFWWDIENDFMFWKLNPEFNNKFEKLIKGNTKQ